MIQNLSEDEKQKLLRIEKNMIKKGRKRYCIKLLSFFKEKY